MTFHQALAAYAKINAQADRLGREWSAIGSDERYSNGLTPDHIKASDEYKTAAAKYRAAEARARDFNRAFTKAFKKEWAAFVAENRGRLNSVLAEIAA